MANESTVEPPIQGCPSCHQGILHPDWQAESTGKGRAHSLTTWGQKPLFQTLARFQALSTVALCIPKSSREMQAPVHRQEAAPQAEPQPSQSTDPFSRDQAQIPPRGRSCPRQLPQTLRQQAPGQGQRGCTHTAMSSEPQCFGHLGASTRKPYWNNRVHRHTCCSRGTGGAPLEFRQCESRWLPQHALSDMVLGLTKQVPMCLAFSRKGHLKPCCNH